MLSKNRQWESVRSVPVSYERLAVLKKAIQDLCLEQGYVFTSFESNAVEQVQEAPRVHLDLQMIQQDEI